MSAKKTRNPGPKPTSIASATARPTLFTPDPEQARAARQAAFLSTRYRLSPALATVVAELAFATEAAR